MSSTRINNLSQLSIVCLVIGLLILLLMPMPILATHRYILFSGGPILILFGSVFVFKNYSISLSIPDLSWGLFCICGLISYFWTTNPTLIWFPLAMWLCLVLWLFAFRIIMHYDNSREFIPIAFFCLFILSIIYISIIYVCKLPATKYFGYNTNYLTLYLLGLWPFLFFYKNKSRLIWVLKWLCFALLLYVFYCSRSKGNAVLFIILMLLFVGDYLYQRSKKDFIHAVFVLISLLSFFVCLGLLNIRLIQEQVLDNGDSSRWFMLKDAFKIFKEYPVFGVGLGNWHNFTYTGNQSAFLEYMNNSFYRISSHNIYTLILVELGLVGLIAYLTGICYPICMKLRAYYQLTSLDKACIFSITTYLLGSLIYLSAYSYESFFSGVQLVAFCALGILTYNDNK